MERLEEEKTEEFLCFPEATDVEQAKARFKQRFGYDPVRTMTSKGYLYVGPLGTPGSSQPGQNGPNQLELF
jgi:hypothetical protein